MFRVQFKNGWLEGVSLEKSVANSEPLSTGITGTLAVLLSNNFAGVFLRVNFAWHTCLVALQIDEKVGKIDAIVTCDVCTKALL